MNCFAVVSKKLQEVEERSSDGKGKMEEDISRCARDIQTAKSDLHVSPDSQLGPSRKSRQPSRTSM